MSRKHYHIVGVPTFAPSAPPRLEFSNFAEDKDVLNLYLLALASIQNDDKENELTSFFQIGGLQVLLIILLLFFSEKRCWLQAYMESPLFLGMMYKEYRLLNLRDIVPMVVLYSLPGIDLM